MTVPEEEATANYGPAAAVIRRTRALTRVTGGKALVSWLNKEVVKPGGYTIQTIS